MCVQALSTPTKHFKRRDIEGIVLDTMPLQTKLGKVVLSTDSLLWRVCKQLVPFSGVLYTVSRLYRFAAKRPIGWDPNLSMLLDTDVVVYTLVAAAYVGTRWKTGVSEPLHGLDSVALTMTIISHSCVWTGMELARQFDEIPIQEWVTMVSAMVSPLCIVLYLYTGISVCPSESWCDIYFEPNRESLSAVGSFFLAFAPTIVFGLSWIAVLRPMTARLRSSAA